MRKNRNGVILRKSTGYALRGFVTRLVPVPVTAVAIGTKMSRYLLPLGKGEILFGSGFHHESLKMLMRHICVLYLVEKMLFLSRRRNLLSNYRDKIQRLH